MDDRKGVYQKFGGFWDVGNVPDGKEHKTDEEVLYKVKEDRSLQATIRERHTYWEGIPCWEPSRMKNGGKRNKKV